MPSPTRRQLLIALAALPLATAAQPAQEDYAELERDLQGELGVAAIDSANGRIAGHRRDQRFPMCSTFKAVLAAAIVARAQREPGLLERRLPIPATGLLSHSPVSGQHAGGAMRIADLCAAIVQQSDNTAANLLLRELKGPAALTRYARSLGDTAFRLDRPELALNSALPGDPRDTTTPLAMARTLDKLLLKEGLAPAGRDQLRDWMLGNTTGAERIRAGVPAGWHVADKTGTGSYGCTNDIGVVYPPDRAPIVLAIYTRQRVKDADARSDIVARAAKLALEELART